MPPDDPIRGLLAKLTPRYRGAVTNLPVGCVAYWRSDVEAAGGDVDAVGAWVLERGGGESVTPSYESKGLRPGRRVVERVVPGRPYFYVLVGSM